MIKISVITPVYNAGKYVSQAVESALQFDEVYEVLLIEDNSPDNTLEVCRNLVEKYNRVQLLQHPDKGNHGAGASRNLGIENAKGDFIAFLDADDYYLTNRFDAEKELFKNQKIEGVFGALGTEFITEKGKEEFLEKFKNSNLTTVKYHAEGKDVFEGLLGLSKNIFGSFFHLNTLTIRRTSLEQNNLLFNKELRVHQDSDFIIKLAYHCYLKSGIIDQAIAVRGIHDDNRITKIKLYSKEYNQRQLLLWKSLYVWAKKEQLKHDVVKSIFLQYKAFEISQENYVLKLIKILYSSIKYREILKTRYRFTYTQKK